ncbi:MAG: DUF6493 family protein [Pseudomonadota bacterium]
MTEDEILTLLTTRPAPEVPETLAAIPQKERRRHAKAVFDLFKDYHESRFGGSAKVPRTLADPRSATVGLFACATFTQIKSQGFLPYHTDIPLADIVRALEPDWVQALVDHNVNSNPNAVHTVAPLWQAGLCGRPEGEGVILGYFSIIHGDPEPEKVLLEQDVWRFFEVEGGGEFSLANYDKYCKPGNGSWSDRLIGYADVGKLDRQRLLDASLDALERDFGQYRAGWFSRFHTALAPTAEERTARAPRYLRLLGSTVPPTVSFALKAVQALEKEKAISAADLVAGLEPVLYARAKGTVSAALKLLARSAKRDPSLTPKAAAQALNALVCEDAGVQGQALDLFEALGGAEDSALQSMLAEYTDLVAPSQRTRLAALACADPAPQAAPAAPTALAAAHDIAPVASANDALALFLAVVEGPRDPLEVERAIDGLLRFGAELSSDADRLSPLKKRAHQVWANPGETEIRAVLALTGIALCDGTTLEETRATRTDGYGAERLGNATLANAHLRRNDQLLGLVRAGHSLPMLSLPSDSTGTVTVDDLVNRLAAYRERGAEPCPTDLSLAFLRLPAEGRPAPDATGDGSTSEGDRALAYALGADVAPGPTPELWASAWRARQPRRKDPRVIALFDTPQRDCGTPVRSALEVRKDESPGGEYFWVKVLIPSVPPLPGDAYALPAIYAAAGHGRTYADIAWASITCPSDLEPFFRQGIASQDTCQKLTDNPTRGHLEPFFRPTGPIGNLGAGLLAYDMAVEDKSVSTLAAEAATRVLKDGRLSVAQLTASLKAFLLSESLPTARWTRSLKAMAEAGAATHVREIIAGLLTFPAEETPRDMGGMLELYYELCIASSTGPDRPETRACLETIKGGGKVAKFAKKLRALAAQPA